MIRLRLGDYGVQKEGLQREGFLPQGATNYVHVVLLQALAELQETAGVKLLSFVEDSMVTYRFLYGLEDFSGLFCPPDRGPIEKVPLRA